jgi:hypothetical protein
VLFALRRWWAIRTENTAISSSSASSSSSSSSSSSASFASTPAQAHVGVVYAACCCFRAILPRIDVERTCLIWFGADSILSTIVIGRSVATVAEVLFGLQVCIAGWGRQLTILQISSNLWFLVMPRWSLFSWCHESLLCTTFFLSISFTHSSFEPSALVFSNHFKPTLFYLYLSLALSHTHTQLSLTVASLCQCWDATSPAHRHSFVRRFVGAMGASLVWLAAIANTSCWVR